MPVNRAITNLSSKNVSNNSIPSNIPREIENKEVKDKQSIPTESSAVVKTEESSNVINSYEIIPNTNIQNVNKKSPVAQSPRNVDNDKNFRIPNDVNIQNVKEKDSVHIQQVEINEPIQANNNLFDLPPTQSSKQPIVTKPSIKGIRNGKSDKNIPKIIPNTSTNKSPSNLQANIKRSIFDHEVQESVVAYKEEVEEVRETGENYITKTEVINTELINAEVMNPEIRQSANVCPQIDYKSDFNSSHIKSSMNINYNNMISPKNESLSSIKEKIRSFNEAKISLETQLEMANKKCEIYQKEIESLRKTINELKVQLSKANEESYKLEISRLKHNLAKNDQDRENLTRENQSLKQHLKKYEENMENMVDDNRRFRSETEKKFAQYNKEIENLMLKQNNITGNVPFVAKESTIDKKDDHKEKDDTHYSITEKYLESNLNFQNVNNYKREIKNKNPPQVVNNQNNISNLSNNITTQNANENANSTVNNKSNVIDIDKDLNEAMLISPENDTDNYDRNNFTNGNPNIIEEVGADNYLNMNGNTYDEMKDMKEDDDHLQDHQYYENIHTTNNANYDPINMEYSHFNKKANTGDTFNNHTAFFNQQIDQKKGESGASETNNIFGNAEEEKEYDETNIFDIMTKNVNQSKPINKEKQNKISSNRPTFNNEKDNSVKVNANNNINFNKLTNQPKINNTIKTNLAVNNKKNLFEENDAFDIFDKSDNAENIFDTFSKKAAKNAPDSLFD